MTDKSKGKSSAEIILNALEAGAQLSVDLATVFFRTRYKGVLWMKEPIKIKGNWSERYRRMQSFYTRLNQLKRDGLVEKQKSVGGSMWVITAKGTNFVNSRMDVEKRKSAPNDGTTVIISYDVPEKLSRERRRLREILKIMDFAMVHKSVWVGQGPVPQEFLEMLREKELVDSVHIFEVGKMGTLRELTGY